MEKTLTESSIRKRIRDWEWKKQIAEQNIKDYDWRIKNLNKQLDLLSKNKESRSYPIVMYADLIARALTEGIYDRHWAKHYEAVSLEYDNEDGWVLTVYDYDYYKSETDPAGFGFKIFASDHLPLSDYGCSWAFTEEELKERPEEPPEDDEFEEDEEQDEVEEDD